MNGSTVSPGLLIFAKKEPFAPLEELHVPHATRPIARRPQGRRVRKSRSLLFQTPVNTDLPSCHVRLSFCPTPPRFPRSNQSPGVDWPTVASPGPANRATDVGLELRVNERRGPLLPRHGTHDGHLSRSSPKPQMLDVPSRLVTPTPYPTALPTRPDRHRLLDLSLATTCSPPTKRRRFVDRP